MAMTKAFEAMTGGTREPTLLPRLRRAMSDDAAWSRGAMVGWRLRRLPVQREGLRRH